MQQVIVKPRNTEELQLVTQLMKRMKIKADVIEPTLSRTERKQQILDSIERGAREVSAALRGEVKLKSARELLNEL
jgi:hypothetical protein